MENPRSRVPKGPIMSLDDLVQRSRRVLRLGKIPFARWAVTKPRKGMPASTHFHVNLVEEGVSADYLVALTNDTTTFPSLVVTRPSAAAGLERSSWIRDEPLHPIAQEYLGIDEFNDGRASEKHIKGWFLAGRAVAVPATFEPAPEDAVLPLLSPEGLETAFGSDDEALVDPDSISDVRFISPRVLQEAQFELFQEVKRRVSRS